MSRDPILAAHRVLAALALIALDHSGSQACVRPSDQACRRGLASCCRPTRPGRYRRCRCCWPRWPTRRATARSTACPPAARPATRPPRPPRSSRRSASRSSSTRSTRRPRAASPTRPTPTSSASWPRDPVAGLGSYPHAVPRVSSHDWRRSPRWWSAWAPPPAPALASSWSKLVLASGAIELSAPIQRPLPRPRREPMSPARRRQITAPTQQTVTLTSASGRIPFSISNPLPYPVRVAARVPEPEAPLRRRQPADRHSCRPSSRATCRSP